MRLSILLLLIPSVCLSQQTINAEQFFALGLSGYQEAEGVAREKVNFPWIDKYEFRTETHDFDTGKQEYTFRLAPSTAKIRKAQKAYYEEMLNAPDIEAREIYSDLILTLHLDWLSLYILNETQSALDELAVVLNDKKTVYERLAGTYEFDLEKLVKIQTEINDFDISLNKLSLERDYLLNKYGINNQNLDFGDFITVEDVAEYLDDNVFSADRSGLVDLKTEHEKQLLLREIELEASEKKRFVDFFQVRYSGPQSDPLQERVSVGMGFQLSTSGSKKLKMQELQIEQEELKLKAARKMQEKKEELLTLENKLKRDLQAYYHFQETVQEERAQLQNLGRKISQKEGASPILLLDIEERYISMKIKSLNKMEDLIKDYLKYLHLSGKMSQPGMVNYLSR